MLKGRKVIEINQVLFETNDQEVLVKGELHKGHLKFATDIIISHSQLNQLMNQIQKQNPTADFSNLFKTEKMYDGEVLYSANFTADTTNFVDINLLTDSTHLRQIRA